MLKETNPVGVVVDVNSGLCLNLALRKSNRLITQFYDDKFAVLGIRVGQFSILRAVSHCKVTTNKELQHILVIEQTTLTRNLKPLIRDGLLSLTASAEDQRVKEIRFTKKGEALYKKALPIWEQTQSEMIKRLGKDEAEKIMSLSQSIVEEFAVS